MFNAVTVCLIILFAMLFGGVVLMGAAFIFQLVDAVFDAGYIIFILGALFFISFLLGICFVVVLQNTSFVLQNTSL